MQRLARVGAAVGGELVLIEDAERDDQRAAAGGGKLGPLVGRGRVARGLREHAQELRVVLATEDQEESAAVHGRAVSVREPFRSDESAKLRERILCEGVPGGETWREA